MTSLHIVVGLGLGGSEAYPGVFAPVGGYASDCSLEDGGITPGRGLGFGLEKSQTLPLTSGRSSAGELPAEDVPPATPWAHDKSRPESLGHHARTRCRTARESPPLRFRSAMMAPHFPIVFEREESGVVSAYVAGLPVYAQGSTGSKAECAIVRTPHAYSRPIRKSSPF
jgi:hypothetical protein